MKKAKNIKETKASHKTRSSKQNHCSETIFKEKTFQQINLKILQTFTTFLKNEI